MISPTTVTTLPGTGLPSTAAATVVVLQGLSVLSPIFPSGLSKVPFSGVNWGCRMSRATTTPTHTESPNTPTAAKALRLRVMVAAPTRKYGSTRTRLRHRSGSEGGEYIKERDRVTPA